MDTISLYYFTEAAKDLNFTQTADRLFLSQQNLSNHIARLESHCGYKLFLRKPRLQLTYEGELFLDYSKEAVMQESSILTRLKMASKRNQELLRIGVTAPRASIFIPEIIEMFALDYPNVSIELIDRPSYVLEQQLSDNIIDFCVGVFHSRDPDLTATHLLTDRVYLCMTEELLNRYGVNLGSSVESYKKSGISMDSFPEIPVVFSSDNIPLSRAILSCYAEVDLKPNVLLKTTYPQMFSKLYLDGTVASFMTEMILSDLLHKSPQNSKQLHAFPLILNNEILKREITISVNSSRYLSAPTQHLISLIKNFFSDIESNRLQ